MHFWLCVDVASNRRGKAEDVGCGGSVVAVVAWSSPGVVVMRSAVAWLLMWCGVNMLAVW